MSSAKIVARIRLCGGMILMLYVICHLSNLSLGLWSLRLMDLWRPVIMGPWQSRVGQSLLYGALASHVVLGLVALSNRRGAASMAPSDVVQLALGLLIPPLLASHLLASRGAALLIRTVWQYVNELLKEAAADKDLVADTEAQLARAKPKA